MMSLKNPSEVGSASRGFEEDACASSSSFSSPFLATLNRRRLFFKVVQPRRIVEPTFDLVVERIDETLGADAARMITVEGGPVLASHILIQPWTPEVPFTLVEQVAREVEMAFRELGYRDLTSAVGDE